MQNHVSKALLVRLHTRPLFVLCCLILALPLLAAEPDSLRISLVTCAPGPEIFELYGHEGVRVSGRVRGRDIDQVYNYGMFDFSSPGFVSRFVAGQTDYYTESLPTGIFLGQYAASGRGVTEHVLPLTPEQARAMYDLLEYDVQPGHSYYRYKYFTDNCATRPLHRWEKAIGGLPPLHDGEGTTTYRTLLRRYNAGYPWYQFGIDLVLGSMLDRPISRRQASFIPVEMDRAYFAPGTEQVLVPSMGDMRQAPTPWWLSPLFVAWTLFALTLLYIVCGWRSRVVYTVWFLLQGLAGCLVCYLVFCSEHEGTSPNVLAWWLNPLGLLIAFMVWVRPWRRLTDALLTVEAVIAATLLVAWFWLPQSTNPAVFPLMGITLLLAASRRY